jgi:hypothetical protein
VYDNWTNSSDVLSVRAEVLHHINPAGLWLQLVGDVLCIIYLTLVDSIL